jgi:hypothetical protein
MLPEVGVIPDVLADGYPQVSPSERNWSYSFMLTGFEIPCLVEDVVRG